MSSRPGHHSKPASEGEAVVVGENQLASAVSAGEETPPTLSNSINGESVKASDGDKAVSSNADVPTDPQPQQQGAEGSDGASATSNATQSETRPTRSRTRAHSQSNKTDGQQNGDKRYQEQDSSPNSSSTEEEKPTYLDALASTLAHLDERAYKRALLRDANYILENIVNPMSFPWAHRVLPVVRNIPRDIDEMPAIQAIDDAEHEVCALKHSIFDLHQSQVGFEKKESLSDDEDDIPAVARRADQPGEIELITCAPSIASSGNGPSADTPATESKCLVLLTDPLVKPVPSLDAEPSPPVEDTNVKIPGELSLQLFEEAQEKKRRKLEAGKARLKTLMISVKVDSTSSRRALFNKSGDQERLPLLLPAVLPEGFKAVPKGKHASRVPAGRSQMTWITKSSMRTSQRVSFRSHLTNEKIENGTQKRPREVSVGIRINGKLLSSAQVTADQLTKENLGAKRKRTDGKIPHIYPQKVVSDALKEADAGEHRIGKRQCTMDTEEFAKRILSREVNKEKSMGWNSKVTIKNLNLVYVTPRIDCLPTEDGLIHVLCTSVGELPPANVENVLNEASRKRTPSVCTVCWRAISVTDEPLSECSKCGVLIHMNCCQSSAPSDGRILRRRCAGCSAFDAPSTNTGDQKKAPAVASPAERSSRRSSRTPTKPKDSGSPMGGVPPLGSCALCPHTGGAMSLLKRSGNKVWVHDVCRIWCDQAARLPKLENGSKSSPLGLLNMSDVPCVLCGTSNSSSEYNGIVKCAAAGCSIHFHPMCALYLSKCEEIGNDETWKKPNGSDPKEPPEDTETTTGATSTVDDVRLAEIIEEDKLLCKQYSFRFAKCAIPESHAVRRPAMSTSVLPVCFCGIHNPDRDRSLYGLYPGGAKIIDEEVMRVPPKKPPT